ncbi:ATP-binding protein [Asanoa sp. NPDC050611]|uniref:ATP-binding protein n=1 Tax=Asanoa sp. NPDC050611 TaxID=3157098 RepID=UPI0033CFA831
MTRSNHTGRHVDGYNLVLETAFDGTTVTVVRRQVQIAAHRCHMDGERLDGFLIAVNEAMTNAVRHGGGSGQLLLWRDGVLLCQVVDRGPGFDPAPYLPPNKRPQASSAGGMGLWLAREMADDLRIHSDAAGTTISISGAIGAGA